MKKSQNLEINWDQIIKEFSDYKGKLSDFCKMKGISRSGLYYHRKLRNLLSSKSEDAFTINPKVNLNNQKKIEFTKINLKAENEINSTDENYIKDKNSEKYSLFRIEIGKAKILIDKKDEDTIRFVVKEIYSLC